MAKSQITTAQIKTVREYNALRAEILTWIQVEYALIVASATLALVALAFFKEPEHWFIFSGSLLGILSAIIGLTSFARVKIILISSYLIVFHNEPWERRIRDLQMCERYGLATTLHQISLFGLYCLLGLIAVGYPLTVAHKADVKLTESPWFVGIVLSIAIGAYLVSLIICVLSYKKQPHIAYWESVKAKTP